MFPPAVFENVYLNTVIDWLILKCVILHVSPLGHLNISLKAGASVGGMCVCVCVLRPKL